MPLLTVIKNNKKEVFKTDEGITLIEALTEHGVFMDAPCGGFKKCKKCEVIAAGGISPISDGELTHFGADDGRRLACYTTITDDCEITLSGDGNIGAKDDGVCREYDFMPRADACGGLGVAVDIGTTTVVAYLYDMENGEKLATASGLNVQRAHGADVISRITCVMERENGLELLRDAIRGQINGLVAGICPDATKIKFYTVAGNTTMQHLFAGISPAGMAASPFTPASLFGFDMNAADCGLPSAPGAKIYMLPSVAGYVGGDITAAVLASGMTNDDGLYLLIDIGTNGEMALGGKNGLLSCATAAGPAFEGADITCGMGGVPGAVSKAVFADGKIKYEVIGDIKPIGICGSGLIDTLALMLQIGAVDETGRLMPPDEVGKEALPYITENGDEIRFTLTEGVFVTDRDVRKIQLAKAAIAAGVKTLLARAGKIESDITAAYISGGFGSHINNSSAAAIGLYPPELLDRIISIGNGAGMGASAALRSCEMEEELARIKDICGYIELSGDAIFMEYYVECMSFEV